MLQIAYRRVAEVVLDTPQKSMGSVYSAACASARRGTPCPASCADPVPVDVPGGAGGRVLGLLDVNMRHVGNMPAAPRRCRLHPPAEGGELTLEQVVDCVAGAVHPDPVRADHGRRATEVRLRG